MCNRNGSPLEAVFQTHSVGMGLIRDCALNGHDLLLSLSLGGHAKTNYVGTPAGTLSLNSSGRCDDRTKSESGTGSTLMVKGGGISFGFESITE